MQEPAEEDFTELRALVERANSEAVFLLDANALIRLGGPWRPAVRGVPALAVGTIIAMLTGSKPAYS